MYSDTFMLSPPIPVYTRRKTAAGYSFYELAHNCVNLLLSQHFKNTGRCEKPSTVEFQIIPTK